MAMSLLDLYQEDFASAVRAKGQDYFRKRRVTLTRKSDEVVNASVMGTQMYDVMVGWDKRNDAPFYDCTCEFMDSTGEPCKHCWAVVLQAQSEDTLPRPVDEDERDDGDEEDVATRAADDADDDDDDEDGDAPPPMVRPFSTGLPPLPLSKKKSEVTGKDVDAWKKQLKALTQQIKGNTTYVQPSLGWPPGRRVVYVVDRGATLGGRGLVIDLCHESPKRDGAYDRPKQLKVSREQIDELPDALDRQILQMLLGARRGDWGYYGYYEADAPRRFELPESAYHTTLKLMCDSGRCRIRRDSHDEYPTRLEWDDGPPWEFWLEVVPSPGGRYLVLEGSLRRPQPVDESPLDLSEIHSNGDAVNGDMAHALSEVPVGEELSGDATAGSVPDEVEASVDAPAGADTELAEPAEEPPAPAPGTRMSITSPDLLVRGGLVFVGGKVARLDHNDAFDLIIALREGLKLSVPLDQKDDLLKTLFSLPRLPRLQLPPDMSLSEFRPAPKPQLLIRKPATTSYSYDERLVGTISFDYGGRIVTLSEEGNALLMPEDRQVLFRDSHREGEYLGRLLRAGFKEAWDYAGGNSHHRILRLSPSKLPKVVSELTREGWHVEAEGKLYRQPGEFKINVSSGIDWFELHGEVTFGDQRATLPQLLSALRRGETSVKLDDGTFGLLPQEWLKKYAGLAGMGEQSEDHVRFTKRQVGFLDALLTSMPEARCDETFARARDELMRFKGIEPLDPPKEFQGQLRAYQREGLGWMSFLRKFGFGGCLADDMGLGKTVQVLALLESRRQERIAQSANAAASASNGATTSLLPPTTLVVAPRSLIFNWKQEAARFCPDLKVLDHTSIARDKDANKFAEYDLILTTYGTLRRDMAFLKDFEFDYAVLDEAQAIKNSASESAKAARLIKSRHRLALSGTPVQNHLGELWSLFEFINPGMMGSAGVFKDLTAGAAGADPAARDALSRALRPFVLRRTKEQVATDLPEKLEQTVFCELEAEQRKLYNELRDHYRTSLLERVAKEGMNKAKIMVLEALLRLRQAACHPGLIDKKRSDQGSAKLDALIGHLEDVLEEGHKVLVFSQFTTFLALVRKKLDADGTVYEYLDGKTKDRQAKVERFQNDPDCKLFLISLKAGGLGLNLTAAEYVFLLDPWWNPAVEAQAIDRAHRIGQTQRVFAYRLIAKDTVEEKVLQLQQSKKDLADAIINADNSLIRSLNREDLELLLS